MFKLLCHLCGLKWKIGVWLCNMFQWAAEERKTKEKSLKDFKGHCSAVQGCRSFLVRALLKHCSTNAINTLWFVLFTIKASMVSLGSMEHLATTQRIKEQGVST